MDQPITPVTPKKYFPLWPLIILVFLLLGITAFLAYQNLQLQKQIVSFQTQPSPSPESTIDPTSNWKTYTNTKYGFSIKYPGNWSVKESLIASDEKINGIKKYQTELESPLEENKVSLISINPEGGKNLNVNPTMKYVETTVGGIKAKLYSFSHDTGFKFYGYFESEKYPEFSITVDGRINDDQINQILSTFQFLD